MSNADVPFRSFFQRSISSYNLRLNIIMAQLFEILHKKNKLCIESQNYFCHLYPESHFFSRQLYPESHFFAPVLPTLRRILFLISTQQRQTAQNFAQHGVVKSLFYGRCSLTVRHRADKECGCGLNPCSNGICSLILPETKTEKDRVLILVLMEYALWWLLLILAWWETAS